jgi:hypothetical protein
MAVLLSRCRTETLTRDEFSAVVRWLARWRELCGGSADAGREAGPDGVAPDGGQAVGAEGVLGKLRHRLAALRAGESPEALKLGSALSSAECIDLMQRLLAALSRPATLPATGGGDGASSLELVAPLEAMHRWLGGDALSTPAVPSTAGTLREREQIAVFGRVLSREPVGAVSAPQPEIAGEIWQALPDATSGVLIAWRTPDGTLRLNGRSLVGVRMNGRVRLATLVGLMQEEGGPVRLWLAPLAGEPRPALVNVLAADGVPARRPALFVPADAAAGVTAMLFVPPLPPGATIAGTLPAGLPSPSSRLTRGEDFECWGCA